MLWLGRLKEIHSMLLTILRRLDTMAVDQATFDTAFATFLDDLTKGLAAIEAKLHSSGSTIDLSAELAQLQSAKAAFDAVVTDATKP